MRWIYLAVLIVVGIATAIFALQNLELVSVSFLGFSARLPLALVIVGFYLIGAATGGSLIALLRRSYEGYKGLKTSP